MFVYYQLENFYQNHRRYVKSRDYKQLMGELRTPDDISETCKPIVTNDDLGKKFAADGTTPLVGTAAADPCGLVAKSFFTDEYSFYSAKPDEADLAKGLI